LSSSGGDPAFGAVLSSVLEELLLLELLLELLESEPGIGGAEPGNGCSSAADGRCSCAAGASGGGGDEVPGIGGAGVSPGKGNFWAADGSFSGAGAQGVEALSSFPVFFVSAGADGAVFSFASVLQGGPACVCAGACIAATSRTVERIAVMENGLTMLWLDYSFSLSDCAQCFDSHKRQFVIVDFAAGGLARRVVSVSEFLHLTRKFHSFWTISSCFQDL
jgi:hypothetical protein